MSQPSTKKTEETLRTNAAGHVGHLFGTLGDAPITLMFVQLDHKVTLNDACWHK